MATWRVLSTSDSLAVQGVDLLLPTQTAARAQATTERVKPGIVRVSVHFCPHAVGEGADGWYNCKTDSRAQYEER